jgi:phosphomannomutase
MLLINSSEKKRTINRKIIREFKKKFLLSFCNFFLRNYSISDPDPTFPTVPFPNPEEGKSALNLSMSTVEKYNTENAEDIKNGIKGKSIHILANDPDADRLAVAEYSER